MFCSKCGSAMPDTSLFCDQCGQPAPGQAAPQPSQQAAQSPVSPPPPPYPVAERTSGKALASMITGIIGLPFFPIAIAAIILGHMSRSEIRKSNGRLKGNGMATAGLVMGYGALAIIPFILAIPSRLRGRIAANEYSTAASLRDINTAETAYASIYPTVGYASTLTVLGGTTCTPPDKTAACLLDMQVASGQKSGYRFELRNCINSETEGQKYQLVAYPILPNQTGIRAFCSDETSVIKFDASGSPDNCLTAGQPLK